MALQASHSIYWKCSIRCLKAGLDVSFDINTTETWCLRGFIDNEKYLVDNIYSYPNYVLDSFCRATAVLKQILVEFCTYLPLCIYLFIVTTSNVRMFPFENLPFQPITRFVDCVLEIQIHACIQISLLLQEETIHWRTSWLKNWT